MDKFNLLKKTLGKKVKENEPMGSYTTVKIGGPARLFIFVEKEKELIKAVRAARKFGIEFLVIGEGSNILVHDKGFEGLVVRNCVEGTKIDNGKVCVGSGTKLQEFIDFLIGKGFSGMEKMFGIPGTVGGAIYGNAGAYGQTISDNLLRVKVFDGNKTKWFFKRKCNFRYRESVFKNNSFIILEAEFIFEKSSPKKLRQKAKKISKLRSRKYPSEIMCPGSFYKNVLSKDLPQDILKRIPKERIIHGKIPAGYLLEVVGAKGKEKGGIKVANYHGNLFINEGNGKASDFYSLAEYFAKKVEKRFGIKLEPEVQLVGFNKDL